MGEQSQRCTRNPRQWFPESRRVREADDDPSPRVHPRLASQAPATRLPVAPASSRLLGFLPVAQSLLTVLLGFFGVRRLAAAFAAESGSRRLVSFSQVLAFPSRERQSPDWRFWCPSTRRRTNATDSLFPLGFPFLTVNCKLSTVNYS